MAAWMQVRASLPAAAPALPGPAREPAPAPPGPVISVLAAMTLAAMAAR
jgi:hypothetical protein